MKKQLQSIEQDIEFGDLKLSASKCKELFDVGRQAQQTRFIKTLCNYLLQVYSNRFYRNSLSYHFTSYHYIRFNNVLIAIRPIPSSK